jgi:hypothetical protein
MELNNDGRPGFEKCYLALQAVNSVTFTMWNKETGIYKIANAPAEIVYDERSGCEERYLIQYKWKKYDTDESGRYIGQFKINFSDDIVMEGVTFPKGELIVPIEEDLYIDISDGGLKK